MWKIETQHKIVIFFYFMSVRNKINMEILTMFLATLFSLKGSKIKKDILIFNHTLFVS